MPHSRARSDANARWVSKPGSDAESRGAWKKGCVPGIGTTTDGGTSGYAPGEAPRAVDPASTRRQAAQAARVTYRFIMASILLPEARRRSAALGVFRLSALARIFPKP